MDLSTRPKFDILCTVFVSCVMIKCLTFPICRQFTNGNYFPNGNISYEKLFLIWNYSQTSGSCQVLVEVSLKCFVIHIFDSIQESLAVACAVGYQSLLSLDVNAILGAPARWMRRWGAAPLFSVIHCSGDHC